MLNKNNHSFIVIALSITSFLTAIANVLASNWAGINVYQINLAQGIPVGAVFIGMGAASGGLLVCRLLNIKPTKRDALFFTLAAALTIWLIYYLSYITAQSEDGHSVKATVDFFDYFKTSVTTEHFTVGKGSNRTDYGETESFGYFILLVRFFLVIFGGYSIFLILRSSPLCRSCRKYLDKIETKLTREMTKEVAMDAHEKLKSSNIDAYKAALTSLQPCPPYSEFDIVRFKLTLFRCPNCKQEMVSEEFQEMKFGEWEAVSQFATKTNIPLEETVAKELQRL